MGKGAGCLGSCRLSGSSADGLLGHVTISHNTSEKGQLSDLADLGWARSCVWRSGGHWLLWIDLGGELTLVG